MTAISYQNWYVGMTAPIWDIPLATDAGNENLTGITTSNITMIFRNTNVRPSTDTVGTGTFYIKNVYPGELYYKPSIADVANPFSGFLIVRILFGPSFSAADEIIYDYLPFVITA